MTGAKVNRMSEAGRRCTSIFVTAFAAAALFSATAAQGAFFDTAGKSARPMGMGEVFLAATGDATSYWYNPAGLAKFEKKQAGLSYGLPVAAITDLSISQVNLVAPLGGNMGLGLGVSYGGIDVANDMVVSGGYGWALSERLAIGGNVKLMRWSFEGQEDLYTGRKDSNLSKTSFSLDLSASYGLGELFGLGNFTTGVFIKDVLMPNISKSGDDGGKLPVDTRVGLMMQKNNVIVEGDVGYVDGNTVFRVGGESDVSGTSLKLRGGFLYGSDFKEDTEKLDINLGLGYRFGTLVFDYAFNLPFEIKGTDGKHFISFGVSF